jgi:CopG family transcriptional regulator/antitoxin EndoAI
MKRINIILPEETIRVLDRLAPRGNRSWLISDAVLYYATAKAKDNLAERLKQGALANAQRDLELAQEWFPMEEEAWQRERKQGPSRKGNLSPPGRQLFR